jgi:dephospho-CoA kinase
MNNPKCVGITGGIGAGKSTVAKLFALLGIPVYDADSRAKLLMITNADLMLAIIGEFGDEAYTNNTLNRAWLAERVFQDEAEVQKLNSLVHPVVASDFDDWAGTQTAPYVLKEAALLFETGSYQQLSATILVTSPIETRIKRIALRDPNRSENQIHDIISRQMPVADAVNLADYIIKNDEENLLIPQVLMVHKQLLNTKG